MSSPITRRTAIATVAASFSSLQVRSRGNTSEDGDSKQSLDRINGMLIGSFIGDAAGGPVEFAAADLVKDVMPNARAWPDTQTLNDARLQELASSFPLLSYETLRPAAAPYGPWKRNAPAGTITDDSRMKIILMRAIERSSENQEEPLTQKDIAHELLRFQPRSDVSPDSELQALITEGLAEYRFASRWLLNERDEAIALPIERLWGGVANCSGQMMMTPLAALFPGRPEQAYRSTYALDFIDTPAARDICAALNAGLAAALSSDLDDSSPRDRWAALFYAMTNTDPFRYRDLPYVGRPLHRWLDLARQLASEANGSPAALYQLLETKGKPAYWWDAHFTLLVPVAMLHLCEFNALAAMHLCLDFGHDTDSYAQLLGAMSGAVHGNKLFPTAHLDAVATRLKADFGEDVRSWTQVLRTAAAQY